MNDDLLREQMAEVLWGELYPHEQEILCWAVGEDWAELFASDWPMRIRDRTGLKITESTPIGPALRLLRQTWEELHRHRH